MEDSALGSYNISISIVGHNKEGNAVVLQLPNGVIVNAVISKTLFAKYIQPLIENPPIPETILPKEPKIEAKEPVQVKEVKEPVPTKIEDLWYDPIGMFDDIRYYAATNGRAIVPDERPGTNRIAWKCKNTEKSWSVELSCLKEALDGLDGSSDPKNQSLAMNVRKCIATIEGRQRLCASFNSYGL